MSKYFSPKAKQPVQMPVEDRPAKPFHPGDIVEMMDGGFQTISKGERCTVDKLHWGNTVNEWCVMVYSLSTGCGQGYRSSRFKLIEKGKTMRPVYAIFELTTEGGTLPPTIVKDSVQLFEGNVREVEEAMRGLLKVCPEKQYAYGFVNMMAKVDAPPVTFTKL